MKIHLVVIELLCTGTAELTGTFLLLLGASAPKSECGSQLSASAVTQDNTRANIIYNWELP
jgi:hypothetical protein